MKNIIKTLRSPAIISFILVLPFMILEFMFNIVNKLTAFSLKNALDFTVLFSVLWLLPTALLIILMPIVQNVRAGNTIMANPGNFLLRVALSALITMMWGGILIDQFPCFIGLANCD